MKRFLRRWFWTWIKVDNIGGAGSTVHADATRFVRLGDRILRFRYSSLIGIEDESTKSVKWMMKGDFINPNSALACTLNAEFKEFRNSGFTEYKRFKSYSLTVSLLKSLDKTPPLPTNGNDDDQSKQNQAG